MGDDTQITGDESEELKRLRDIAARAQADLQNAKARIERDAADIRKFATVDALLRIVPTLDNFQRAFTHMPAELSGNEWVKGIVAIEQDLVKVAEELGLKRMSSMGQLVDPERHEVLSVGPGKADTVSEVFEEGYELHGKVVRPAKVKAGDGSVTQ